MLAIETATDTCSVALQIDGEVREQYEVLPRRQTERVLPMVDALLKEAGVSLQQLDAIAFSQGPGAFTGVRVAVSIAQGLAFSSGVPLIGVSTLACTAQAAASVYGEGNWLVVQDARMGEVYVGAYRVPQQAPPEAIVDDMLCAPDEMPPALVGRWRAVGSGELHQSDIRQRWPALSDWYSDIGPRATAMLPLAIQGVQRGDLVAAELARPVYLRNQVIQGAIR